MDRLLDKKAEFQFDISFGDQQYRVVVTHYNQARDNRQWSSYIFSKGIPRWRIALGTVTLDLDLNRIAVLWDHDTDSTAPDLPINSRVAFLDAIQIGLDQLPH